MQFSKEILKGAAEIIVLHTLQQEGKAYGYQLIKAIRDNSQDIFDFQEGTLYPLLYRLEEKKLVTSAVETAPSGKSRRYYALTKTGKARLKIQMRELKIFVTGVQQLMQLS